MGFLSDLGDTALNAATGNITGAVGGLLSSVTSGISSLFGGGTSGLSTWDVLERHSQEIGKIGALREEQSKALNMVIAKVNSLIN